MILLPASGVFLFLSILFVAGFFTWLLLRLYVLHILLSYRPDCLRLVVELGSSSRNAISVFMRNEGRQWFAGIQTPRRPWWQHSWTLPAKMHGYRMWRRVWTLWKHSKRPALVKASHRFLAEIYEQLRFQQMTLKVRLGLPSYPQTGYLAAVAYPLNFTLFRTLGSFRPMIIPDFSARGLTFENQIRCTFRGYQLWKPSYHFLNSPEVRHLLWSRLSKSLRRLAGLRSTNHRPSSNSGKGGSYGKIQL